MKQKSIIVFVLLVMVIVFACEDKDDPVGPKPEPEEHLFYISPWEGNFVKVFSVEQEAFIDSFVVDSVAVTDTMRLHVIGDDSLLAVSAGSKTYIYDLENRVVVESFEARNPIFSRDSRYYLDISSRDLFSYPGHILVNDNIDGGFPSFDVHAKYIPIIYWKDSTPDPLGTEISVYSIESNSIVHGPNHIPGMFAYYNQMSSSYQKVFWGASGTTGLMIVTDFDSDSVRTLKSFANFYTTIPFPVISPNEKLLFFTSITGEFWGGVPDGFIYVFDVETEDSIAAMEFSGMNQVGNMVITYDSKYLIAKPFNEFRNMSNICLIDASNFKVLNIFECGFLPRSISSSFCSKGLE